jgi:hypothetical protein
MNAEGVKKLIKDYKPHLYGTRSTAIRVETKVMTIISYLCSGGFQWSTAHMTGQSQSKVSRILEEPTNVTLGVIVNKVIKFPTTREDRERTNEQFYALAGFPNIVLIHHNCRLLL